MAETALVTGSTTGLGLAIAQALAASGYRVAVHGRDQAEAERVAAGLVGAGAAGFAADLSDGAAAAEHLLERVVDGLGEVAVLVNNAADQSLTPLEATDADAWRALLDVNVLAAVELTRRVCQAAGERARVVNVASVEGLTPFPGHSAYAASKAALLSFTRSAAAELAPARVNAVAPGLVDRPGLAEQWPTGHGWWARTSPLGRPVTPQEVAAVVVFLASPEASGVTGVTLPVDGGWSASARM